MSYFLKLVADDLKQQFGRNFGRVAVIFPGKRAALFLDEYLKDDEPMFMPSYFSIDEFFTRLSPYAIADPIESICRLYDIYIKMGAGNETLDAFYGWGERLLADFDEMDKSMADADQLLRNLSDIKVFETNSYLEDRQKKLLADYIQNFKDENSEVRKKFLALWEKMPGIYAKFRTALFRSKATYEGALYRDVVERLDTVRHHRQETDAISLPSAYDHFVFVGFNVLSEVEKRLFAIIRKQQKARFYWDYDLLYAGKDESFEAGRFLRENMRDFPNALDESLFDNFSDPTKLIELACAATETIEAKSVTEWLQENLTSDPRKTAVVLCNEALLQPVLHSLPEKVREANITKGFPLSHTPACRDLEIFCKAWLKGENSLDAELKMLQDLQEMLKAKHKEATEILYIESYFKLLTIVNRFHNLVEKGKLEVEPLTLIRLLREVAHSSTVPFHGEPLNGLQIMGVLETRCLDFDNILMLSVGEGFLPKASNDASFIPYFLRTHYGLQTSEHRTAVYAYYFYRLLQRAKYVRLVYNKSADGLQKGEMSRFIMQLQGENSRIKIHKIALTSKQELQATPVRSIAKPENLAERLKHLSPSAINQYFHCELAFYYAYVLGIREPERKNADDPRTFGTIFHGVAEEYYKQVIKQHKGLVTKELLEKSFGNLSRKGTASGIILRMIEDFCTKNGYTAGEVVRNVIALYLEGLFRYDYAQTPFVVDSTEKKDIIVEHFPFTAGGKEMSIRLKGSIDRVDIVKVDGVDVKRIVDYKTGGSPQSIKGIEELFEAKENRAGYVFQTLFYAYTLYVNGENFYKGHAIPMAPALFYTREAMKPDFEPYITIEDKANGNHYLMDYTGVHHEFEERLRELLGQHIFNPEEPFKPTPNEHNCKRCPYHTLCGR